MPSSALRALCAGRSAQTGEKFHQALTGLGKLEPGAAPVPDPGNADQAYLESCLLEQLGRCHKDRWRRYMLPFAVRSVTPEPDRLVLRVPTEYLPDILGGVMPHWLAEEEEQDWDTPEVYGIPGLRARHERGRILLERLGFPGRIAIPASRDVWCKAIRVVVDMTGGGDELRMPWLASPREWQPAETRFTEKWPDWFSPSGQDHRTSLFASQLMRRLPGLYPSPRGGYHDMWFNRHGGNYDIQLEWENGAARATVLARLLDPEFGPGAEIDLLDGQTTADCYSAAPGHVRVRSTRLPAASLVLRRVTWPVAKPDPRVTQFGETRRARRAAIETKHGYYAGRRPRRHIRR